MGEKERGKEEEGTRRRRDKIRRGKRGMRGRRGEDREETEKRREETEKEGEIPIKKEYHELGVKIFLLVRTTMKINHMKTFDSRTMAQASGMVVR